MRIQRILVGAALLMLCAAAAYAQVTISSTPVTQVIASGKAEVAGTVRVTAHDVTVADKFTITYGGLDITNGGEDEGDDLAVAITGTWPGTIDILDIEDGVVTLDVPAATSAGQYFEVRNVRLDVSGLAAPASISATLGTLETTIEAGQDTTLVIRNIGAGLVAATDGDSATILASGRPIEDDALWTLTEGFAAAWKNRAQAGGDTATNGVQITLSLPDLPEGVEVCVGGLPSFVGIDADSPDCFTEDDDEIVLTFTDGVNQPDQGEVNEIEISFEVNAEDADVPMESATYYVKATLSPNPDDDEDYYPLFAEIKLPTAGFPVFSVVPNTTNFILPYLISDSTLGYNTGIAIANTTKDPYGDDGALAQDGTITVYFYGNDGSTVTYNSATDAVKGNGLTTAGVLKAGSTWTVLAGELLAAKARTTPLTGYAIIVLNATNGHGMSYVSNFGGFTSGAGLLVIDAPVSSRHGRSSDRTEETTF